VKVYLIRHAQSEENILDLRTRISRAAFNELLARSASAALTPLGEQQARAVADRLASAPIEQLFCSPFLRAHTTAQAIGARIGLEPQLLNDLREVLPRPLAGDAPSRLGRLFVRSYLGMLVPGGSGETWQDGYARARRAFAAITAQPAREVAAVAHRATIGLILFALDRDPAWRVVSRDLSNAGVSIAIRRT
jgi:broad specificity phosphatase PhoE